MNSALAKKFERTQTTQALSSPEAELDALVSIAMEVRGVHCFILQHADGDRQQQCNVER